MIITLLRWYFKILLRIYYNEISIEGIENVDQSKPQLFVSNHQNSLIDGLLFITQINKNIIMTTTSKLNKFPIANKILKRANVQIFYRRVDSYGDRIINKNTDSIGKCADLLLENNHVLIFPEGITTKDGKMLPFKTGFARIAERYLETRQDLEVIPVYLTYSNRSKIRSSVKMKMLDPVDLKSVKEQDPDNFVQNLTSYTKSQLEEIERERLDTPLEELSEFKSYLDRVLALPVLLFHFIPSALTLIIGDLFNPREETKSTTRIFLSVVLFPLIIILQILFLISILPLLLVYFFILYISFYIYKSTQSVVHRE